MPRRPRSIQDGELYHVYARGNGRCTIYFEDGHRRDFLRRLGEILPSSGVEILAYCLMDNHFHLIIRAGWRPLGRPMQRLLSSYARTINREAGRQGHLFERRYQAIHVENDAYARVLLRYVHLNPARANIVADPADYLWSSHGPYLGGTAPDWLNTAPLLRLFGECRETARLRYLHYCQGKQAATIAPSAAPRRAQRHRVATAGEPQQVTVVAQPPRTTGLLHGIDEIVHLVAAICRLPYEHVLMGCDHRASWARSLVARAIQEIPGLRLSEFGRLTNRHVATLSNAGRRAAVRCAAYPAYADQWAELIRALSHTSTTKQG